MRVAPPEFAAAELPPAASRAVGERTAA